MTDVVGPFDSASWSQEQWYRHMLPAMPSGVIDARAASASTGGLALLTSGRNVGLDQGRANVGGAGFYRTGAQTANLAVSANTNSSLQRRDRLVLRRSTATNTVTPTVITGTASATPTPPAVTRNDTTWDLPMFSWLTPPASGTTLTGIVDERRFVDPTGGGSAGLGLLGHGVSTTTQVWSSGGGIQIVNGLPLTAFLEPGRAYEFTADLRVWSNTAPAVAFTHARVSAASATPTESDPLAAAATVVIERATTTYRYVLQPRALFQVSASGLFTVTVWAGNVAGFGAMNFLPGPSGEMSAEVKDIGPALSTIHMVTV